MADISRRSLLAGFGAAVATATLPFGRSAAAARMPASRYGSLIDLTRCDGCPDRDTPRCVAACRQANAHRFPDPDPAAIKDYWPQPRHEDWSKKKGVTDRLTPYNWTFVQKVKVEHQGAEVEVSIPRRCMHCDNPPCVKLCPFGVAKKDPEGPTHIDPALCFGGAKCRTVCPWDVPQRQAGVGVYTYLDPMPVGGGVMYKCDLCRDRLARGEKPACMQACPRGAIRIGDRETLFAEAERLAKQLGGSNWKEHIYGKEENGGTSTVFVSRVPFSAIDRAIVEQTQEERRRLAAAAERAEGADAQRLATRAKKLAPMRMHQVDNVIERSSGLAAASLVAPLAGAAVAFAATVSRHENAKKEEEA